MSSEAEAGAQRMSSASVLDSPTPALVHGNGNVLKSTALQYSQCPISSENAMLYPWAAHRTLVLSLEVEYIGWKSHGTSLHVDPFGAYWIAPNPFAALAIIDPDWPAVRSSITPSNP